MLKALGRKSSSEKWQWQRSWLCVKIFFIINRLAHVESPGLEAINFHASSRVNPGNPA
jgi:hypothetical protein